MTSPQRPSPRSRLAWADIVRTPATPPSFGPRPQPAPGTQRGPCAGLSCALCRWCQCPLSTAHEDGEDGCCARRTPDPAVWTRYAATQPHLCVYRVTRGAAGAEAAQQQPRGRDQTRRTPEQQEVFRVAHRRWHASEKRRLGAEAIARLGEYVRLLLQPLAASSPSGEFSDYEQLMLEFAAQLPSKARRGATVPPAASA